MFSRSSTILAVALCAFLTTGVVLAQQAGDSPPANPAMQGHHEEPHDAYVPAPPGPRTTTPGARIRYGRYESVQVNVDANGDNIVGDAANEPSLAVDPTDPDRMVIGWRQFNSVTSDFRQAGWGYTSDGGETWTFPGVIESGHFRSDPVLSSDSDGVFYYNSLTNEGGYQCKVFRSYDGGASWDAGTYAYGGDKQWQTIDKYGGIGDGNIYASWNEFYSACYGHFTRSTDGGDSFESCTSAPGSPYWGTLAVGPDGELYHCGTGFTVVKSTTAQDPSQPMAWQLSTTVSLGGSTVMSAGPSPAGLLGQSWVAVSHEDGPTRGYVYLLSSVDPSGSDPLDVMFSRSIDGGNTWSSPFRINDDSPGNNAWQWFGTMAVAPNGRIDVIWLDTRDDPGGYDSQLYYSYSEDGGETFSANEALTPAFNPQVGWPVQQKMGDYIDMTSENGATHVAFAATFNNEEDVYYMRITHFPVRISLPNGPPALLPPDEPVAITVQIENGGETYVPDTGMVYYRYAGGDFESAPLTPAGGELYTATLPAPQCGQSPEYYFSAAGDLGSIVYLPEEGAEAPYRADVGTLIVLLDDDFEADQGWTVWNDPSLTTGAWQRGVPVAGGGAGAPTADYDGSGRCYVTDNRAGNYDVDGGPTILTSPAFDGSGAADLLLKYARWFTCDDVLPPAQDFLDVEVSSDDGANWVRMQHLAAFERWVYDTLHLGDYVPLTANMRIRFSTVDLPNNSMTEAGIDAVRVEYVDCPMAAVHGDLNCDGVVNGYDIDPFVVALTDATQYAQLYPDCNRMAGDINCDGDVNGYDIDPFVACLTAGACPPCP
jgi:hypothetical protein